MTKRSHTSLTGTALTGAALAGLALAVLTLSLLETATLAAPPPPEAALESPEVNQSLGYKGRDTYLLYCRSCHGEEARGDGSVAEYLKIPPTDLTTLAAMNDGVFPYEDAFKIIDGRKGVRGHGSEMPVWGDAFQKVAQARDEGDDLEAATHRRIEELVHYLMMIQAE